MTVQEWLAQARQDRDKLKNFVVSYHPLHSRNQMPIGKITSGQAEAACESIRQEIRAEMAGLDVAHCFDMAMDAGSIETITQMLNAAWFGVPETTACWRIEGFQEAVELLEDPPEEGEGDDGTTEAN